MLVQLITLRFILIVTSISLAVAVAAGAFGSHQLSGVISDKYMEIWKTAVLYQFIHSLAILNIVALRDFITDKKALIISMLMSAGVLLFSGSLYGLVLTSIKILGIITPFGGFLFIISWLLFCWELIKNKI